MGVTVPQQILMYETERMLHGLSSSRDDHLSWLSASRVSRHVGVLAEDVPLVCRETCETYFGNFGPERSRETRTLVRRSTCRVLGVG